MKQHFKTIILFLLLVALTPVLVLAGGAALPDYYQDSYYAELSEMYQRLETTEGPKIVVVGGSNVAFGLDSALLEELLAQKGYEYTVCPFGLYAAVGASAMLDLSQDTLGEGDIVILAFEPSSETMSTYFGATAFWKCTENAPELLLKVSGDKQNALFGNYISYLQERQQIFNTGMLPQVEGVYAKSSFNERCDLIYDRPGNMMTLGYDTTAPVDLAAVSVGADFAKQVNDYCEKAESAGAQVWLSFSPVNRSALTGDEKTTVSTFFRMCNDTFHCPIISDPNTYIMESGWFYDSNFHLNSAGAIIRTYSLAEDILAWLGCYEELVYELPEMPAFMGPSYDTPTETGHFTYDPITDPKGETIGYQISGLTDSGMEQKELAIPAAYRDKAVVGILEDALSDAIALEQLRIPESVEGLPDNLFRNCKALTQLILEHRSTPCSVTAHTFDGADQVRIFVPAEAYTMYRDGFGCETNPWAPYIDRVYSFQ